MLMKKIITLFAETNSSKKIMGWILLYLIFSIVSTINQLQSQSEWFVAFIKGLLWPVQLVEFILGIN